MEGFIKHSASDEAITGDERHHAEKHPAAHVEFFERPEGTYEEVSFLHEPIEAYKDDLSQIESVLIAKQDKLKDMEEKAALHATAPEGSSLHILDGHLTEKIGALRDEIGRWEVLRTITQQRVIALSKQEYHERRILDHMPTDIEQ